MQHISQATLEERSSPLWEGRQETRQEATMTDEWGSVTKTAQQKFTALSLSILISPNDWSNT